MEELILPSGNVVAPEAHDQPSSNGGGGASSSSSMGQALLQSRQEPESAARPGNAAAEITTSSSAPSLSEPRRLASTIFSGTILGEEEPSYAMIRREASAPDNRRRFEDNQREAMREAFQQRIERSPGWFCLALLCAISVPVFLMVLYIYGWVTYFKHGSEPCDRPLATWLLVKLCQQPVVVTVQKLAKALSSESVIGEWCEARIKVILQNIPIVIDVTGFVWWWCCRTCPETNPALYNFVELYIIVNIVITLVCVCGLIVVVSLVVYGVANGWFDTSETAADAGVLEALETVEFNPELFARKDDENDSRPAGDCCCCTEEFGHDKEIKRTPCSPCQHYFHKECLEQWLKRARTCPLCRTDLQEAVKEQQQPADSPV